MFDELFDGSDAHLWTHVYPTHDSVSHNTQSNDCWCSPEIDEEHHTIIHNSYDQRETYEQGRKKQ